LRIDNIPRATNAKLTCTSTRAVDLRNSREEYFDSFSADAIVQIR